jgi:hypothetical protein
MALPSKRPRIMTRTLASVGALTGLGAAFIAGTSYGGGGVAGPDRGGFQGADASPAAFSGSGLALADSCSDLLASYVELGEERVGPWGWDGGYGRRDTLDGGIVQFDSSAGAASGELKGSFPSAAGSAAQPAPVRATNEDSGTNVQEAGVDEPDSVKTDGRTLFRLEGDDLVTYDVTGAEVERIGSADLPGLGPDTELLLTGETVVVISRQEHTDGSGSGNRGAAEVVTLDVTDPARPTITHTASYDARPVTARLHDGVVRLVLQAGLPDLDFVTPNNRTTDWEATQANRALVRESSIEDWLPTVSYDDGEAEQLLACDAVAVPDSGTLSRTLGTIAVVGFDAPAPDAPSVSGLAVDTELVYASSSQLYLATSPYDFGVINCIDCIEPLPVPQSGIGDTIPLPRWFPGGGRTSVDDPEQGTSHLYAFDLAGLDTTLAAAGEVDGVIQDRWSMDADGGVLRVAVGPTVKTGDFNSIVTFRQEGNDLIEAGRLDELGVGEQIQSVRWFDTLAILVTFRQVDPLYAIDLTEDEPVLMGELKIPGFSAYLHPLGQHRLLGLGEGPADHGQWGAQAGLFNVTDLTDPTQLDVVSYGSGSQALATQEPRQLTWLPDGRTVLSVVADHGRTGGQAGYVSVLTLDEGELDNRMVEVEHGSDINEVRLVPIPDGRVILVTGGSAAFFDL